MSLYNMVVTPNPASQFVLGLLELDETIVPRYRDAWIRDDGEALVVLARVGGGNRKEYADEIEAMREVAGYLGDHDVEVDATFAEFEYAVPEHVAEDVKTLVTYLSDIGIDADSSGPGAMIRVAELGRQRANEKELRPMTEEEDAALERVAKAANAVRGKREAAE